MICPLPTSLKCSPCLLPFPPHIPHAELLVAPLSCLWAFVQSASSWSFPSLPSSSKLANSFFLQEVVSDTLFTPSPDWCSTHSSRFTQYSDIYHPVSGETGNPTSSSRLPTPFCQRDTVTKEVHAAILGQWRRNHLKITWVRESCRDLGALWSHLSVKIGMRCPFFYHTVWFGVLLFLWDC